MKLASFIAALALAQNIQVYNNGARVGQARPVIDCRGTNTCTISGGSVRITGDGGSGSSGPTWATLYDCDFTAQGNVPLDGGDGDYSVCSEPLVLANDAKYATRPDLSSTGLRIVPVSATEWGNGGATTAALAYIRLSDLDLTNIGALAPIRMTVQMDWNGGTNGDAFEAGVWHSTETRYQGAIFFSGGAAPYWSGHSFVGTSFQVFSNIATFANNARMVTAHWSGGLASRPNFGFDLPDAGAFPSVGGGLWAMSAPADSNANIAWMGTVNSARFILAARRASNAHSGFYVDVKRLKIETLR